MIFAKTERDVEMNLIRWTNYDRIQSHVTLTSTYNVQGNSVRAKIQKVTSGCVRESDNV